MRRRRGQFGGQVARFHDEQAGFREVDTQAFYALRIVKWSAQGGEDNCDTADLHDRLTFAFSFGRVQMDDVRLNLDGPTRRRVEGRAEGELAAELRRSADLTATLAAEREAHRMVLDQERARGDRLEAALAEARRPLLLRLVDGLRRR